MASLRSVIKIDLLPLVDTIEEVAALAQSRLMPRHVEDEFVALLSALCDQRDRGVGWFDLHPVPGRTELEAAPTPRFLSLMANLRACAERTDA